MHEFECKSSLLKSALSKLAHIVDKETKIGYCRHIRIEMANGKVAVAIKSLNSSALAILDTISTTPEPCTFIFDVHLLGDIVKVMSGESIVFKTVDSSVKVSSGSSSFSITSKDPAMMPAVFPDFVNLPYGKVNLKTLFSGMTSALYATSKIASDEPNKRAVYINDKHFVGTNGYRMAVVDNNILPTTVPVLVPGTNVKSLSSIYSDMGEDGGLYIDGANLYLSANGVYTATNLFDAGKYYRYVGVMPKESTCRISAKKTDLLAALDHVGALLKHTSEAKHKAVLMEISGDNLTLSGNIPAVGSVCEVVSCSVDGPTVPGGVLLNSIFLAEAVSAIDGDSVEIGLTTDASPVALKDGLGVHVIVPLKKNL